MNRTKRTLLSGVLGIALFLQTTMPVMALPSAVSAAEPAVNTIVGFSALEQTEYTLPVGADETAVNELLAALPETITVNVDNTNDTPQGDIADDSNVTVSGNKTNKLTGEETISVEKTVSEQVELAVTWQSAKPLTTGEAGAFIYTAQLSDTDKGKYALADGVRLPALTVTVALMTAQPRGAIVEVSSASDLNAKIAAAISDTEFQLKEGFSSDGIVKILNGNGYNFTIDLNGQTVTSSRFNTIEHLSAGKLTITDRAGGGTISNTYNAPGYAAIGVTKGVLEISSGTVTSIYTAVSVNSGTLVNINGGTLMSENTVFNNSGTILINSGTITGKNDAVYNNESIVTINSGTITGENNAVHNNKGIININGGTITGKNDAVYNNEGRVNINKGTLTSEQKYGVYNQYGGTTEVTIVNPSQPAIIKGALGAMNTAPTLDADSLGWASTDVSGEPLVSYDAANVAGYKYLKFGNSLDGNVRIGDTYYATLQDAIDAVNADETIVLQQDLTETVIIQAGRPSFTLDLNGKTLTASDWDTITHEGAGALTITDSGTGGTVGNTGDYSAIFNNASGTVNINGGEVSGRTGITIYNNASGKITVSGSAKVISDSSAYTIYLKGGSVGNAVLEVSGGTVTGGKRAIYCNSSTVTISGGTMSSRDIAIIGSNSVVTISGGTIESEENFGIGSDRSCTVNAANAYEPAIIKGALGAMNVMPMLGGNTVGWASTDMSGTPLVSYNIADFASYKYLEFEYQTLSGIEITAQPGKTAYTVGERFNPAGMVVSAIYHSNRTRAVTDYTISPYGRLTIGDKKVTVSYTFDNVTKTAEVPITVSADGGSSGGNNGGSSTGGNNGGSATGGNSGGSSTGGNSGSNTAGTTPPATTKNLSTPTQGNVTVTPIISGDTATVNVPASAVSDAITKAKEAAKKNGKTDNGILLEIKANTGSAANLTANLPKAAVDALVSARVKEVKITSGVVTISLNLNTLQEIRKKTGGDIIVTAIKVVSSTLANEAKALVGNRPVYNLNITGKNGTKVTSFGSGTVTVSIPYTLGAKETAGNVVACYIDGKGKATELPNSVYNAETKTLGFVTSHFSVYAVGYKQKTETFTDIAGHPAKDSIEFVAARGLLAGTSDSKFSPDTAMTRGMFVTALGRLAGADVSGCKQSSFIDVNAGTYYLGYIEWAVKNNIVQGIGNGKFAPDQAVSREQMAVIMQNYAKAIGFELPRVHEQNTYADNDKISGSAKDAVKVMQMAGILAGKNGNWFDPQGTATRAEAGAALKRFVELTISAGSASFTFNANGEAG